MIETDPEAAWKQIEEDTLGLHTESTRRTALLEIAKSNPEEALKLSNGKFDAAILGQTAITDPDRALALFESTTFDGVMEKQAALAAIAKGWATTDLSASIAWARENLTSFTAREEWLNDLVSNYDPAVVLPLAIEAGYVRSASAAAKLGYRFRQWLLDDQSSALAWLDHDVGDSRVRHTIMRDAASGLYGQDQCHIGLMLLSRLPNATRQEQHDRTQYMERLTRMWMREDAEVARKWMMVNLNWEKLNDASGLENRLGFRSSIAGELYHTDPDETLALIEALPSEDERLAAFGGIIEIEAVRDPARAMILAEALPDSKHRTGAILEILENWWETDQEESVRWALRQPPGVVANQIYHQMVGVNSYADPAGSLGWAAAIDDPALQFKAASEVLISGQRWREYGFSAEQRWKLIDESQLLETTKVKLREKNFKR